MDHLPQLLPSRRGRIRAIGVRAGVLGDRPAYRRPGPGRAIGANGQDAQQLVGERWKMAVPWSISET
jgi:hypothetical protein